MASSHNRPSFIWSFAVRWWICNKAWIVMTSSYLVKHALHRHDSRTGVDTGTHNLHNMYMYYIQITTPVSSSVGTSFLVGLAPGDITV